MLSISVNDASGPPVKQLSNFSISTMSNTATRLLTLLMLLQRQPNQKAGDLAEELGVSVRTLHRYIGMLEEMGIPVYSERGPHGGFSLVPGYKMPPLVFTPEEAVAIYLGTGLVEEMWGQLYRDAARGALAKLDNVLPDEQRHEVAWARRKLVATSFHRSDQEILAPRLEKLRRAVRERRRVQMSYRGRNQIEATQRQFDPFALVHRWGWWYAVGYCHMREAQRTFRVDRILALTLLDQTFSEPADFDIQTYLEKDWQAQPDRPGTNVFRTGICSDCVWMMRGIGIRSRNKTTGRSLSVSLRPTWNGQPAPSWPTVAAASCSSRKSLRHLVRDRALGIAESHNSVDR